MPQNFTKQTLIDRTFAHQKLTDANFLGANLSGADFQGADLRGANFQDADLTNANFTNAQAGLSPTAARRLLLFKLFLTWLSGLILACSGIIIGHLYLLNNLGMLFAGVTITIALLIFCAITFKKGINLTLGLSSLIAATILVTCFALAPTEQSSDQIAMGSLALAGSIAGIFGIAEVITLNRTTRSTLAIALFGIICGALIGISEATPIRDFTGLLLLSSLSLSLANYIGKKAIHGDPRYQILNTLAIQLSTLGGTSFKNAILNQANFTGANLISTDLRAAELTHTCWSNANLNQTNGDRTYLENPQVRELLVTGNGQKQNLNKLNLRNANLDNINLAQAELIGTDLSNTTLRNANLKAAKLCHAQLHDADLSGAILTGATIENWGISTKTQFDNIQCDYIFTRNATPDNPDTGRKPNNSQINFRPGDFNDFIAPIVKALDSWETLDLIHYAGLDPTAAAIAVTQLTEAHPEAKLELVSLDGRGNDKVRLQAIINGQFDRGQLYDEYFQKYNQLRKMPYNDIQAILVGFAERDDRIKSLESMLNTAIQQPKYHIETHGNQGEINMSESKGNITIGDVIGNISGIASAGENQSITGSNLGAISGTVTNSINQIPPSDSPDKPNIKDLLQQLQSAIESNSDLSEDDKGEALKQVKAIAENCNPNTTDNNSKKIIKNSLTFLKGLIADIPISDLGKTAGKLLPVIAGFFGI